MSTPSAHPRPAAPHASAAVAIAGVLFGLAAVLGVMAVVYLVLVLTGSPSSTAVCGASDTSIGECLLSSQISRTQAIETWGVGLTLVVGAATSAVAGGVALLVLRRR